MCAHVDEEPVGRALDDVARRAFGEGTGGGALVLEHPVPSRQSFEVALLARDGELHLRELAPVRRPAASLATSLPLGDQIVAGSLQIDVERDGVPLVAGTIAIDPSLSLNDLVTNINTDPILGAYLTASVENNSLKIEANLASDTFGFARDDSHVLTALGTNTFFTGDKAYTLEVNAWVLDNPDLVAAGQIAATGAHAVGDNRNALALADLEHAPVGPDGLTFGDAYQRLVTSLGLEAQEAGDQKTFYQGLVEQLTHMRDAVSAVSLDEELTNLVKFQRAYQAAA